MANNQGRMGFSIDFKKGDQSGLRELRTQLEQLQQLTVKEVINTGNLEQANKKLEAIQGTAKKVQQALEDSYNAKLDTTDLNKFQKSLQSQGLTLKSIKDDFVQAGTQGQIAFRNLNTELLTTSRYTKQTSEWLDKMANTLGNTVRWSIASTAVNSVTGSIQKAYGFTKQLDSSLNDIRIVTEKSAEEMDKFARKANAAAKALGATTTDYTKASLIYYQQGLSDREVEARANVTTKVANVTGVSADAASEQLTAIWNGYKVQAQEAELYIDKVSAVAATTAADLEELSVGMSKVASAANIMGVDIDQLNAQLATIVSVTREAPESIGTALKTVYARMSDIEAGLDSETTLGEYTEQMAQMGINALDAKGNLRDMGEVVEEIGDKWATLNRNQQTSLAQTIAGTRQYSRMMALFDNWEMYQQSKATSEGAAGALEKQNEIYLDSMEAHLNQLSAAAEGLYDSLLDPESLNKVIDLFTKVVGLADQFVQSLGGGGNLLMTIGAIGFNVFDKQISRGISSTLRNAEGLISNLKNANAQAEFFTELMSTLGDDDKYKDIVSQAEKLYQINSLMTDEEKQQADLLIKRSAELVNQESLLKEQKEQIEKLYSAFDSEGKKIDLSQSGNDKEIADNFKSKLQDADLLLSELGGSAVLSDLLATNAAVVAVRGSVGGQKRALTRAKNAAATPIEDAAREGKYVAQQEYSLIGHEIELNEKVIAAKDKLAEKQQTLNDLQTNQNELLKQYYNSIVDGNKDYASSLDIFEKSGLFSEDEINDLKEAEKLFAGIKDKGKITEKQIQDVAKSTELWNKAVEKTKGALKDGSEQAEKLSKKISDIKNASDKASDSLKKFINSFQISKAVDGVVQLAGGLANVGTAASNIKNLGNIWSDESLTGGEKLLQTLSNVSFTVPMVVSGLKNLTEGWSNIGASIKDFIAIQKQAEIATQAYNAIQTASQSQLENRAFWDIIAKAAKEELTEEQWEEVAAILATEGALSAEQIAKLQSVLGDGAKLGSQKALSVAIKNTTKNLLEQTAAFLTSPAGMILLGVAAAVAAITIAVKVGSEAYNKYNLKMEEASKAAEHQAQVYQDVKKAYEDLKASLENYEGAQKAIDEMTEGTEEWRDAIIEANKEVTELIEKYPQLARYLNRDENNRLTLDPEGLRAAQLEASKASDLAYSQSVGANAALAITKNNAKAETIAHNSDYATFGTVLGGVLKTWLPVISISEAIVKKDVFAGYENETSTEDILKIAKALNTEAGSTKNFRQLIEDTLEGETQAQIDALEENSDEIRALAEQLKNTADAEKELSASIMDAYLRGTSSDYRESEYQAQISAIAGNAYDEALERAQVKFADNGMSGSTYTDAQIQQMYADMMVATGQWQSVQHVSNKSGNKGKYTYIDASGTQQSDIKIDDINARQALAVYEAQKEAGGDLSKITDILEKVLISGNEKVDKQLANMLAGRKVDLNALNASEKDLFADLVNDIELTNEEIAQLGKESIDKVKETALSAFDKFEKDMKEFIAKMNPDSTLKYENIRNSVFANSQLTSGAELALAQMYGSNNTIIIDTFEQLAEKFGERADDFLNLLPGLGSAQDLENWKTAIYGETEFREILNDNLFKDLVSELETTFDLYDAYSKKASQESFAYLKSLTSKVSQWGDVISKEDFAKLPAELKTYFTEMADGTALLTDKAFEFVKASRELAQQTLIDDVIQTKDVVDDIEGKIKELTDKYVGKTMPDSVKIWMPNEKNNYKPNTKEERWFAKEENVEEAYKLLAWLSDNKDPNTGKSYISGLKDQGYDVESWYDYIINQGRVPSLPIFQLMQDTFNNAGTYKIEQNPVKLELRKLNEELTTAEEDALRAQQALAAGAGTKENWEKYKKEDWFSRLSLEVIAEWNEFYNNQEKYFERQIDLSYKITNNARDIAKINKIIQEYSEDFDKAFGNDKLSALTALDYAFEDLNDELNEDLTNMKTNIATQQQEFSTLHLGLQQFGISYGDVEFDKKTGEILNYDEIVQQGMAFAARNGYTPDQMNALFTFLGNYNQLLDDVKNKEEEIEENRQNWYENDVKRFETLLQNQLDYTEAHGEYNNFLREMADEEDYGTLNRSYIDEYTYAIEDVLDIKEQITKIDQYALEDEDKRAQLIALQTQLQEKMLSVKEAYNQLLELEVDNMDAITDGYDKIVTVTEQLAKVDENRFKIQQLMGAGVQEEYEFYQGQIAYQKEILTQRKKEYDYWQGIYNNKEMSTAARDEARTRMLQIGADISSLSATLAQEVANNLERSIDAMMETTFGAIEKFKSEYDWLIEDSERTYDTVTGMFRINELQASVAAAKAQNASINAQRKLNEFVELEIDALREKDKLTEHDYERAKARFELLQAQIALEEAQANKTQMRLVRGADGQYSYQYVADSAAIADKEQAVFKAQESIMKTDQETVQEYYDGIYNTIQDFIAKFKELFADGVIDLTEASKLETIWTSLLEQLGGAEAVGEQFKTSLEESASLLGITNLTDLSEAEMQELFPWMNSELYKQIQSFMSGTSAFTMDTLAALITAANETGSQSGINKIFEAFGFSPNAYGDYNAAAGTSIDKANTQIGSLETSLGDLDIAVKNAATTFDNLKIDTLELIALLQGANAAAHGGSWSFSSASLANAGMATGGYTGAWGPSGKLAVLHEKELVLNKEDTPNILAAVDIVRNLSTSLDLSMAYRLAEMMQSYEKSVGNWEDAQDWIVEQQVNIQADFSGVRTKDEIVAAFNELVNMATQKAMERKK